MSDRLFAGGDTELWYSDDGGTTWISAAPLPGRIEGLWGPRNLAPKIYTVVHTIGLYTWEDGVGWTLELANANAACGFGWVAQLSQFWCADDDSVAYTTGIGPVRGAYSRQGPPGSPWTACTVGVSNVVDIHGSPDGSAVFAVEVPAFINWTLYQHVGGGTFAPVHAFPAGTIYQLRVVSPTEVRLFGFTGNVVQVWIWNGATLVLEFSFDVSTLGGAFASWAGAWMSADGQDGGVAVNCAGAVQGVYLRRTAGVWALDDGDIQSARPMTRSAGIQSPADDRLLFSQGRFQRRSGGLWVDAGWEPIGTWTDNPPDGYDLFWQEVILDAEVPRVAPEDPERNSETAEPETDCVFTVVDDVGLVEPWYVGIHRGDGWEIALTYNFGTPAFQPGFAGLRSAVAAYTDDQGRVGYRVRIDFEEDFDRERRVFVAVAAKDAVGNPAVVVG
jgi:hypothetical protein